MIHDYEIWKLESLWEIQSIGSEITSLLMESGRWWLIKKIDSCIYQRSATKGTRMSSWLSIAEISKRLLRGDICSIVEECVKIKT